MVYRGDRCKLYVFRIGQYLKIGTSTEPATRFAQCARGDGNAKRPDDAVGVCDALLVVDGTLAAERAIHALLAPLSTQGTEWYICEGLLADWAERLTRSEPNYGAARRAVGLPRVMSNGSLHPDGSVRFRPVTKVAAAKRSR